MKEQQPNTNKNANDEVDALHNIWLGRWFVVQTPDDDEIDDIEQEIREIRGLLEND